MLIIVLSLLKAEIFLDYRVKLTAKRLKNGRKLHCQISAMLCIIREDSY